MSELRQRLPAAERRSQLIEVALDRFAASGFHGTSMEEIGDAAGVTKPVLYQHFGSKHTLYLELLETVGRELADEIRRKAAAEDQPFQQVLVGFQTYFHFVAERTSGFVVLFGGTGRPSDEASDAIRAIESEMAAIIAEYIVADIDKDHRQLLGEAIVGLAEVAGRRWVDGLAEGRYERLDPVEGDLLAERLADLVWAGLRGLPGGGPR